MTQWELCRCVIYTIMVCSEMQHAITQCVVLNIVGVGVWAMV